VHWIERRSGAQATPSELALPGPPSLWVSEGGGQIRSRLRGQTVFVPFTRGLLVSLVNWLCEGGASRGSRSGGGEGGKEENQTLIPETCPQQLQKRTKSEARSQKTKNEARDDDPRAEGGGAIVIIITPPSPASGPLAPPRHITELHNR
jgi:hypothetical protein